MKIAMLATVLAAGLSGAGMAAAQDVASAEKLYQRVCKNCHGPKAQGLASYPKLVDKDAEHIRMRLEQYRAGEKIGPNSPLMIPHAKKLSDEDITELATYITTAFE